MESPAVGCQLSSDNPLSLYFALTTHFDGSVGSGIIDLNAQIRSMASKSSFDKTLLAGTQKSQVLPGFFGTRSRPAPMFKGALPPATPAAQSAGHLKVAYMSSNSS